MKKFLLIGLMLVLVTTPVFAEAVTSQFFASWVNVNSLNKYVAIPSPGKSLMIQNGSAYSICVSLSGGETVGSENGATAGSNNVCGSLDAGGNVAVASQMNTGSGGLFMLDADSEIYIENYTTDKLGFSYVSSAASPVNIIINY